MIILTYFVVDYLVELFILCDHNIAQFHTDKTRLTKLKLDIPISL